MKREGPGELREEERRGEGDEARWDATETVGGTAAAEATAAAGEAAAKSAYCCWLWADDTEAVGAPAPGERSLLRSLLALRMGLKDRFDPSTLDCSVECTACDCRPLSVLARRMGCDDSRSSRRSR